MTPKCIDVAPDGRTATGIWYLWEPAVAPDPASGKPRALWLAGYDAGWAKARVYPWRPAPGRLIRSFASHPRPQQLTR